MAHANPLVSVVVPTYNDERTIADTLSSVLKQSHQNLEIWVIDDGSRVDILPIIRGLNDSRLNYYKLPEHQNANVARNEGIRRSNGEYIAMLDADDIWMSNHLEDSLTILRAVGADGVYSSLIIRSDKGERVVKVRGLNHGENMVSYLLQSGYGAQSSTLVMTARSAKDILWDATLKRHQDYDFVTRYCISYKLTPKFKPSVIYTLQPEGHRKIDFESCVTFINRHKQQISPWAYTSYHVRMYNLAERISSDKQLLEHYRREATRYASQLSYIRYIGILKPQNRLQKIAIKMRYITSILRNN